MAVLAERGHLGSRSTSRRCAKTGSRYASDEPRLYSLKDENGKSHKAYRLVLYAGAYGEYYGVQGMTWRYPPILDDPDGSRTVDGRQLISTTTAATCGSWPGGPSGPPTG